MIVEKKFRRLNSPQLLEQVYKGQLVEDGIEVGEKTRKRRAAWSHLHVYRDDLQFATHRCNMRCGQIRQIRSVLSNPASVLKSDLELSHNLVGG